ncbi:MAG: maleylacetate reductase [Microbacterium sp.]|uniref:iron-containing alcohol dehydrogenase n=1 Tax=Microbacterium sp. TaxID=51671 RepID=UPI000DB451ED|nr:iron-containing alcohol dehydrogenase [Microbacterium sp.]PZU36618.1 MAG: maleylacetate reductase [Microbacterium sp.]
MNDDTVTGFSFRGLQTPVTFGRGSVGRIGEILARVGIERVVVLTTSRGAGVFSNVQRSVDLHGVVGVFDGSREHVPVEAVAEAWSIAERSGADGAIALGGGSSVGLAKALARRHNLPYVAVPTTLAGSEMTSIWGETDGQRKATGRDAEVRAREVVYDPDLVDDLPVSLAAQSAVNALAHVAESAYAPDSSPVVRAVAREAAHSLAAGLRSLGEANVRASDPLLVGAMLAGMCLDATTMGLHHAVCHALGGSLSLPHAATHSIVLPHSLALTCTITPLGVELLGQAFDTRMPGQRLQSILAGVGAPISLESLGAARDDVVGVAPDVLRRMSEHPGAASNFSQAQVEGLLFDAWKGVRVDA